MEGLERTVGSVGAGRHAVDRLVKGVEKARALREDSAEIPAILAQALRRLPTAAEPGDLRRRDPGIDALVRCPRTSGAPRGLGGRGSGLRALQL